MAVYRGFPPIIAVKRVDFTDDRVPWNRLAWATPDTTFHYT